MKAAIGKRRILMGMVGGGPGAFIGPVHRIAAELDRQIELVAGAFSSDAGKSALAGEGYGIDPNRAYASYEAMIAAEAQREDGIDLVAIVTPNHLHLPVATAALQAGLAVMSDKPATATLAEAVELARTIEETDGVYGLSYTYSGYPMVREARARIADGSLGRIRKVVVEYFQGWLGKPIENEGSKQAAWRVDPSKAGLGGCIGDIGVHAFQLAEFVLGDRVDAILPDLGALVPGRALDDDCTILIRFSQGAKGYIAASQVATGEGNGLVLRVYGEEAGLCWRQESPNELVLSHADGRSETLRAGGGGLAGSTIAALRLPLGHPEGYLEAFANLYGDFARKLRGEEAPLLPGIGDGVRSMAFVEAAVRGNGAGWQTFSTGERA